MNMLKKQSVAVLLTMVMIAAAVGIGQAKANFSGQQSTSNTTTSTVVTEQGQNYTLVYDEAEVLSKATKQSLSDLNDQLLNDGNVAVAVVTTNYGRSDLGSWAINYADNIGLGAYDFIVVLDISGDNYWLVQGSGLVNDFTDDDCGDYAYDYMEQSFAKGDYDSAVWSLAKALADWYTDNY